MKKSLSLLLVLTLILSMFALVGCGGDDNKGGNAEKTKVTLVVPSGFGDKSFNDSAKAGVDKLAEDYDIKLSTIECKGESFKQHMIDAADNSQVVICVGWEFWEIGEVVKEYPDVKFIWIDNETEKSHDNLLNIVYAQNEGSFLAGYVAAKMSKTGVIGAVGGQDSETINDFLVGYKQGAEYANPDIVFKKNYAEDYENPALGKELAQALNDQKADVIFQVAGNTGSGVFEAAQESGFYAIGVDQDQKITAAKFDDVIICSMLKEVGASIYDAVSALLKDGTFQGGTTWVADMANEYISLVYGDENSTQQIPDTLKKEVEEIKAKIVSGEIVVDTTRQ